MSNVILSGEVFKVSVIYCTLDPNHAQENRLKVLSVCSLLKCKVQPHVNFHLVEVRLQCPCMCL